MQLAGVICPTRGFTLWVAAHSLRSPALLPCLLHLHIDASGKIRHSISDAVCQEMARARAPRSHKYYFHLSIFFTKTALVRFPNIPPPCDQHLISVTVCLLA